MTAVLLVVSALLGLSIGSFLNVVVYRVPAKLALSKPPSACPTCSSPIAPYDNVPVLSWLVLRGRCRRCSSSISLRYPVVEAVTGVLFVAVALRTGWTWTTPALDVFLAGLVALACIDFEHYLLPKKVVYPTGVLCAAFLVVGAAVDHQWHRLIVAVLCAAGAFVVFFVLNLVNPKWLGFGDVRLAAVIGLAVGWLGLPELLVGFLAGNLAGIGVAAVLMSTGRMSRTTPMPYGVFLALGAAIAVFAGPPLAHLLLPHAA